MFTTSLFLLTILLAASSSKIPTQNINPYDLEDEIREQLGSLEATVRGAIFAAFNTIDGHVREVYYARNDALAAAEIAINQEYETLNSQLATVKDLAQSAGQDPSACFEPDEEVLSRLPQEIIDSLLECLAFSNREVTIIQNDARYRIDILMNEVHIFDFQLDLCAGDFLCLSPLVTQIELALVEIPQKIGVELLEVEKLCDDLKVLIKECTDAKVAQFTAEGGIIANDIVECVNDLLS